jgi:hypothetical protein
VVSRPSVSSSVQLDRLSSPTKTIFASESIEGYQVANVVMVQGVDLWYTGIEEVAVTKQGRGMSREGAASVKAELRSIHPLCLGPENQYVRSSNWRS